MEQTEYLVTLSCLVEVQVNVFASNPEDVEGQALEYADQLSLSVDRLSGDFDFELLSGGDWEIQDAEEVE